jgi:hypothetical protein
MVSCPSRMQFHENSLINFHLDEENYEVHYNKSKPVIVF